MSNIATAGKWTLLHLFIVGIVLCIFLSELWKPGIYLFTVKYAVLARDQEIAIGNCFLDTRDLISTIFHILVYLLA